MSIFNNNNLDPFGTNSLFADINNTNQQINSMNLPSFAKEEEEKKRKKAEQIMKLRNLADTLNMVNAQKSGNAQAAAMYSNRRRQRQLDEEARLKKAEQQAAFDRQYNLLSEDQKRIVDQEKVGIKLNNNVSQPASVKEYMFARQGGYEGSYEDFLQTKKQSTNINIDQRQDNFNKSASDAAFKRLEKANEVVEGSSDIDSRLIVLEKQVNNLDPVKTGALEELKIPFKKVAAALNILPQEQLDDLTQQELFQSFSGYIIPRMRVVGSGATSDREIELFKLAVPNIGNTVEGNKLLIGGLRSITKYNKNRLKLMEDYLKENKNLLGFGEYADENLGPIYKTFTSEGEYVNQVKNGMLKEGDFVFDAVNNQFIILNKADIAAANQ